jgi:hypothetical protein
MGEILDGPGLIDSFNRLVQMSESAPSGISILNECVEVSEMLLNKNRKYGDSAINPLRVFSRSDSVEQIDVRIDDKLSRIASRQNDEDEDVIMDLIGYLILRRIAMRKEKS